MNKAEFDDAVPTTAASRGSSLMPRFMRRTASRWRAAVILLEVLLLMGAAFLAVYVRFISDPEPLSAYTSLWLQGVRALLFATMMVLGMTTMGLYQTHLRETWAGALSRQAVGFMLGSLGLLTVFYLFPPLEFGRGILALALAFGFVFVAGLRVASQRLIDVEALKQRVLVLGSGERASLIEQRLRRNSDRRRFRVVGYVPCGNETSRVGADKLLSIDAPLAEWALFNRIDEIVFGPDDRRGGPPMHDLLQCKQIGIQVTDLASFFERESGKIKLSLTDPSWLVFSGGFDSSLGRVLSKRAMDVIASLAVLALTWPLLLLVALAIRIESGKGQPILYRQERVGLLGSVFSLIKFRSMRTDAEQDGKARWAGKNDDRITRVGRIIRRTRLDELPQLWNILRGDMSIVGPRPERPEFVSELDADLRYYNLRHCVRPGLAGWAQLRYAYGASKQDAEEKLKYDLFYVKNHNLLFDLLILIQTFEVVVFGRGVR
ncbi:TIGR03013 family XrtA/PEP-CTERM system glycosyltransferase [Luteimonas saliphila]|uniref:TIGR03013 family XrtA/PEP-CTERM system glycosyltransferase n=1 Tax=Luteimonas saliphila TaxID=2804919 RepID=UPI002354F8E7|nr:TIGR03013 family XrtA/PEP-CTERM system glycosyltransferase [Luteimonas saliphila]